MKYLICAAALVVGPAIIALPPMLSAAENTPWAYPVAPKGAPKRDWALLKNGASWLYQDIHDARAFHANLGKKLKGGPLKTPPKPAGKRERKK